MRGTVSISLTVNGEAVNRNVEPRETLADFIRRDLALTGTHLGCEMGACGACLLLMDGKPVHGCLVFAVQADGANVETIEGLDNRGVIAELQRAFHERNALQCGFCTAGMLITAHDLLAPGGVPSRAEIRDALSGNYCRCTGYEAIVDAIEQVALKHSREVQA